VTPKLRVMDCSGKPASTMERGLGAESVTANPRAEIT